MASQKYQLYGSVRIATEVGQYSLVDQAIQAKEEQEKQITLLFEEIHHQMERLAKKKVGRPVNLKIIGSVNGYKVVVHLADETLKNLQIPRLMGDQVYGLSELFQSMKDEAEQLHQGVQEVYHLRITPVKETLPVAKTG